MAEKSGVQSVERIFQLIEHLAAHPTGVSLQRLAEETGLAKSTVHRLLASLVGLGYVVQDEETKKKNRDALFADLEGNLDIGGEAAKEQKAKEQKK